MGADKGRAFVLGGTLLTLAALVAGCAPSAAPVERIVLVTVDTLRADHLGCYGYLRDTAPFLCEMGDRGFRFTNALASGSHTAPTHASLLTSLQPVQHGVRENGQSLDPEVLTVADLVGTRGFETAAFTSVRFLKGVADGFGHVNARAKQEDSHHRPADKTVSATLRWLERGRRTERFFVWVHLYDVHEYETPDFVDDEARQAIARMPVGDHRLYEFLKQEHGTWFHTFDDETLMGHIAAYDAQILFVDRQLRRLHAALDDLDLGDGTLWIVTADHGEGLGSHGYMGHGRHLYNEQLRVPLIMARQGSTAPGATIDALVRHVDLMPTIAALVEAPDAVDEQIMPVEGRSILPLLEGASSWRREPLAYAERRPPRPHWDPGEVLTLQDSRLKYVYRSEGEDELYDLREDPLELSNLLESGDEEIGERLLDRLLGLYAEMSLEGQRVVGTEIDESMIEELRALGYIQ